MADSTIKTAKRIFEVLEHFEVAREPLTLKAISAQFGYPASSASVLLKSMVTLGYLDYDRYSRTYMPTMRMATLGDWVSSALFGDGAVLGLMEDIQAETGETITLGAQSDLYAQHIYVLPSSHSVQVVLRSGAVRPLTRSGLGKILLSARDDATIEQIVRRVNAAEADPEKRVFLKELFAEIGEIRRQGYIYSKHTFSRGAGIISMLLPGRRLGRALAISVLGPVERLDEHKDRILKRLRRGIATLSRQCGKADAKR
ncbi:MAG: IclR family transcriptional regulator [Hyphomonadaceae bacterium]